MYIFKGKELMSELIDGVTIGDKLREGRMSFINSFHEGGSSGFSVSSEGSINRDYPGLFKVIDYENISPGAFNFDIGFVADNRLRAFNGVVIKERFEKIRARIKPVYDGLMRDRHTKYAAKSSCSFSGGDTDIDIEGKGKRDNTCRVMNLCKINLLIFDNIRLKVFNIKEKLSVYIRKFTVGERIANFREFLLLKFSIWARLIDALMDIEVFSSSYEDKGLITEWA